MRERATDRDAAHLKMGSDQQLGDTLARINPAVRLTQHTTGEQHSRDAYCVSIIRQYTYIDRFSERPCLKFSVYWE